MYNRLSFGRVGTEVQHIFHEEDLKYCNITVAHGIISLLL